jgi:isopenicillin N synthase-like dioxygenase
MTLPRRLRDNSLSQSALDHALCEWGGFLLDRPEASAESARALVAAEALFSLPYDKKVVVAAPQAPPFRGWATLDNDRDCREQFLFGREARPDSSRATSPLDGPNRWPESIHVRRTLLSYLDFATQLAHDILHSLPRTVYAHEQGVSDPLATDYRICKLNRYLAQEATRTGLASHVDFAWLSVTVGTADGLEALSPTGEWVSIPAGPQQLWVQAGELLEFRTNGRYRALPHRVRGQSERTSITVFANPALRSVVSRLGSTSVDATYPLPPNRPALPVGHVHRFLSPDPALSSFVFGEAESVRKCHRRWCYQCSPHDAFRTGHG